MRRVIIFLIATIALSCSNDGDPEPGRTSKHRVISEGIDPLLGTVDYNVLTHRDLVDNAEFANSVRDELRLWNAAAASRTVALQVRPLRRVLIGGTCETQFEMGNGFLTGYASLVATDHTDYEDSAFTTFRFGLPDSTDGIVDEHFSRRRAYRLGMLSFADPQIVRYSEFERQILNWKFADYVPGDWYLKFQRDAVLKVTTGPRCLQTDDGDDGPHVRLYGPGMFFDWLAPTSSEGELALAEGEETFIGHVNSVLQASAQFAPLYDTASELLKIDPAVDPALIDIWNLGSLPGYMGTGASCLNIDVDCVNDANVTINNYDGCVRFSGDAIHGSSGGPIFASLRSGNFETLTTGRAWGLVHGAEFTPSNWGDLADADAPEFPEPGRSLLATVFNDAMVDDVDEPNRVGQPVATGPDPSDTETRPVIADAVNLSRCIGRGCGDDRCAGSCRMSS